MINYVTIVGHLGADPSIRKLENGTLVSEFSIACNEVRNADGKRIERTHWFTCTAFGKLADITRQYLKKGRFVGVHGSLNYSAWKDENGGNRSRVKVQVKEIEFLDSKPSESGPSDRVPVNLGGF